MAVHRIHPQTDILCRLGLRIFDKMKVTGRVNASRVREQRWVSLFAFEPLAKGDSGFGTAGRYSFVAAQPGS